MIATHRPQPARFFLGALPLLALLLVVGCNASQPVTNVRLVEVGPFAAAIAWDSHAPARYDIQYGEGNLFDRRAAEEEPATSHRITLVGLKPATRYSYRFGEGGPAFSFRSAPGRDGAFDLALLTPDSPACRRDFAMPSSLPDLVVVTGDCPGRLARRPAEILTLTTPTTGAVDLPFGNYQLILALRWPEAEAAATRALAKKQRPVVVVPRLVDELPQTWRQVLVVSPRAGARDERLVAWPEGLVAWFEFDAFEVAHVSGEAAQRTRRVIVEAPPETRKSCLYCDRLFEAGRYEESIAWYRDFITGNQNRHQIEDAHFAIARILDEKLFRFAAARPAYQNYLTNFPESRRVALARYRIDYLNARDDHDFKPLELFERAKAELVRDDPATSIERVEAMLADYPHAATGEDALFWLGNLLQADDPHRAAGFFATLMQRYPAGENAALAAIARGDIHYRAKQNRLAIIAYERALEIVPQKFHLSIADKLRKARRNIKREALRWASWAVLAAWLMLSIAKKAKPRAKDLWVGALLLAAYVLVGGVYFALHYQRAQVLLGPVVTLAAAMAAVPAWNRALARGQASAVLVAAHALTMSAAICYLVFYTFHDLYMFGL